MHYFSGEYSDYSIDFPENDLTTVSFLEKVNG